MSGTPHGEPDVGSPDALRALAAELLTLAGTPDPLERARLCGISLMRRATSVLADARAAAVREAAGSGHGGKSRVARELGISPGSVGDILAGRSRAGKG